MFNPQTSKTVLAVKTVIGLLITTTYSVFHHSFSNSATRGSWQFNLAISRSAASPHSILHTMR